MATQPTSDLAGTALYVIFARNNIKGVSEQARIVDRILGMIPTGTRHKYDKDSVTAAGQFVQEHDKGVILQALGLRG